jgi:hypothetical protein
MNDLRQKGGVLWVAPNKCNMKEWKVLSLYNNMNDLWQKGGVLWVAPNE